MILTTRAGRGFLVAAIFQVFASAAFAQSGINLAWNDCGSFGLPARTFACDTNAGQQVLIGSAIVGFDLAELNGLETELHLQTNQSSLSDWWQFASGGCRQGALTADFDFTSGPSNCLDPWGGPALGGLLYEPGIPVASQARLRLICAIPGTRAVDGTHEYELFKIVVSNAKSTGAGACAGCTDGMCLDLVQVKLTQPAGAGDYVFTNALVRKTANWQGGSGYVNCVFVRDPVRTRTWGSVKSLYRR